MARRAFSLVIERRVIEGRVDQTLRKEKRVRSTVI